MNVEERIRTEGKIPLEKRTIIHLMLVSNSINEKMASVLKPFDISIQQFNVLRILRGQKGKPANLSTLNERMVTKMSNTTRLVDKLILKGYVERHICTSNRRKVEISITDIGLEQLKTIDNLVSEAEKKLLQQFSVDELEQLNTLLNNF